LALDVVQNNDYYVTRQVSYLGRGSKQWLNQLEARVISQDGNHFASSLQHLLAEWSALTCSFSFKSPGPARLSNLMVLNLLCFPLEAKLEARGRFTAISPLIQWRLLRLSDDSPAASLLSRYLKLMSGLPAIY
jgi:hypothetical protein